MSLKRIWIGELIHRVDTAMRNDFGFGEAAISIYRSAFKTIEEYFIQKNEGYYSTKIGERLVQEKTEEYHNQALKNNRLNQIRRICLFLEQYYESRKLTYLRFPRLGCKEVSPYFTTIADLYVELECQKGILSPKVINTRRQIACRFMMFLEERGHQNFETVVASDIRAFIPDLKKRQPKGIVYTLPIVRKFCILLNEKNVYKQKWADILNVKPPVQKTLRTAFTKSEAKRLLQTPDINKPKGMRDLAMMLLAAHTGLRGIDIINLKLSDIDWRANEITIIQHKTGKALNLPLSSDVGNAIANYILNARPKINNPYIFLTLKSPHQKLCEHSNEIVKDTMKKAGFSKDKRYHKGFHSFRRSLGTWMLEAEVPVETISQILGHSSVEATKPYMGIEFTHLKGCSLDLSAFSCLRGELC